MKNNHKWLRIEYIHRSYIDKLEISWVCFKNYKVWAFCYNYFNGLKLLLDPRSVQNSHQGLNKKGLQEARLEVSSGTFVLI